MEFTFPAIGIIHSCFKEKFGIPRQPGLAPLATAELELLPPYNDSCALDGLEGCSHIWVQFVFHANSRGEWKPKVKPPRLGGNKSLGVFATRSPTRPAPIGLSVVKLEGIAEANGKLVLQLSGVDFLDGTPVLDIKPYVPYVDLVPTAINKFADAAPPLIPVEFNNGASVFCREYHQNTHIDLANLIRQILQQDPRPQYQQPEPNRIYGMKLLDLDVQWQYPHDHADHTILVTGIIRC
jgi:tRNA-Thr(GGU) m(6)t(6)A37 methyltransferase TsaA